MSTNKDITIAVDNNVPIIFGECPKCKRGKRSMILLDYVPHKTDNKESSIYIKCVCCRSIYQTKVKDVTR